jgi:virginiamycin B lyase
MRSGYLVIALAAGLALAPFSRATADTTALAGRVTSAEEGAMPGVVVSAKRDGSTITVSVVSDAKGRYAFPAARLEPGHYALAIRAAGYDLAGAKSADVAAGRQAHADLALRKTKNLAAQLTNAEWLASMPGSDDQKKMLLNCSDCHTLERVARSTHDASEFLQVFERMSGYYPGAEPLQPQRLVGDSRRPAVSPERAKAFADYLASVNLSGGPQWSYPLKTLPRPSGRATKVIVTEYALPRPVIQPHDVIVGNDGMVWYSNFGEQLLSKLDPATGKVTEYPIPEQKKGFPTGTLDLETDRDGNLWIALMYQTGVARFDKATGTFKIFPLPKDWQTNSTQQAFLSPASASVDGKIWVKNSDRAQVLRLDPATGVYENFGSFKDPVTNRLITAYGIPVDRANNVYLLDFSANNIGRLDAKSGQLTVYPTPTPASRPRRGRFDAEDRLWFAEYAGNAIGMLDVKAAKITEWHLPTAWSNPYDVVLDRKGEAWTGSVMSDRVDRLDTRTGRFTEYLMPHDTNIRRVFVDNRTNPVTFWTGSNHGAAIVKVEPLD